MVTVKRSWDSLDKAQREHMIRETVRYFTTERDLELGVIGAEEILDFFLENLSPIIHNKAVEAAKSVVKQNLDNVEIDLDLLINK